MGIENVMEDFGLNQNFVSKACCNLRVCKKRLREHQNFELLNDISNKPKLRVYKEFKTDMNTEEYLLHYINRSTRSLYAQLRCSILSLTIETGRFKIKKRWDNWCIQKVIPQCKNMSTM